MNEHESQDLGLTETQPGDATAATRYLEQLERRFAPSVAGMPPVTHVVDNLTARFGPRLSEFLAQRLVQPQPPWQVLATLGYLGRHKNPVATEPLIRFAAQAREPQLQQLAGRVLVGMNDPALTQKLEAERARLAARGAALPPALASLARPGRAGGRRT